MNPTREQILAEPAGRQMDTWCAEAMGWTKIHLEQRCGPCRVGFPPQDPKDAWEILRYSTDIRDAWQLVERILSDMNPHGDFHTFALVNDGNEWLCVIDELEDDDERVEGRAGIKEAPLAISRAFLLAKLPQQEATT